MIKTAHYWQHENGTHLRYNAAHEVLGALHWSRANSEWNLVLRGGSHSRLLGSETARAKARAEELIAALPLTQKEAQLIHLAAASPLRAFKNKTADVDGLALFDAVRSPAFL